MDIEEVDVIVGSGDTRQLVRVTMMVRAVLLPDEADSHISDRGRQVRHGLRRSE